MRMHCVLITHCTHLCGSSIFSIVGFFAGLAGAIGAVCGILACIGSSILLCCAPKTPREDGAGRKFLEVRKSTPLTATPNPTS